MILNFFPCKETLIFNKIWVFLCHPFAPFFVQQAGLCIVGSQSAAAKWRGEITNNSSFKTCEYFKKFISFLNLYSQ